MSNNNPSVVEIQLPHGHVAIVDTIDSDLALLYWGSFRSRNNFYARRVKIENGKQSNIWLHRVILERVIGRPLVTGEVVDHIDMNTLNNTRQNLRVASAAQNSQNQRKSQRNKSGYKGVSWSKVMRKWTAFIAFNGKNYCLGYFDDPLLAYEAYCKAAKEHHGDFARFD